MSALRAALLAALLSISTLAQTISLPGYTNPNVSTSWLYYNKMRWAGTWSATTTYNPQDVVTYGSYTYVSLLGANLNNTPSPGGTSYWAQLPTNAAFPAGSPLQYLRVAPNTGPTTNYQFATPIAASSADYVYTSQVPGNTLIAHGSNQSIALSPCPLGITDGSGHWAPVYISGGTGTAEAVTPTGGTCTSGALNGTIIVTPTYAHSGAWTVGTATFGLQEAVHGACLAGGGVINVPAAFILRSTATVPCSNITIKGTGVHGTDITRTGDIGDSIYVAGPVSNVNISGLNLVHTLNYTAGTPPTIVNKPTSGAHLHFFICDTCSADGNWLEGMPYGIEADGVSYFRAEWNQITGVWDYAYPAVQVSIAGIYLHDSYHPSYGYPTYVYINHNSLLGKASVSRSITLNGHTITHQEPVGPRFGIWVAGVEVGEINDNDIEWMGEEGIHIAPLAPSSVPQAMLNLDIERNYIDCSRLYDINFDFTASTDGFALGTKIVSNHLVSSDPAYGPVNAIKFTGSTTPGTYIRVAAETLISTNLIRGTLGSAISMLASGGTKISNNIIDNYNTINTYPTNAITCGAYTCTGDRTGNAAIYVSEAALGFSLTGNTLGGGYLGGAYDGVGVFTVNAVVIGKLLFHGWHADRITTAPNADGGVQMPSERSPAVAFDPAFLVPIGPVQNAAINTTALAGCGTLSASSTLFGGTVTSNTSGTCAITLGFDLAVAANGWTCSMQNLTHPGATNAMYQSGSTTGSASFTGTTVSGDVLTYACSAQ